jgi:cell division septum initiation protein DivIVA
MFRGYDPAAVDTYIEALTTKQQCLLNDVESLRARLTERDDEAAALRNEVAALSPNPWMGRLSDRRVNSENAF